MKEVLFVKTNIRHMDHDINESIVNKWNPIAQKKAYLILFERQL